MNRSTRRPVQLAVVLTIVTAAVAVLPLAVAQQRPGQPTTRPPSADAVVRVYDVRDLTYVAADHPLAGSLVPPTRLPVPTAAASGGQTPQSPSLFPAAPTGQTPASLRSYAMDEVKKFVVDNVDAESWKDNGGEVGSLSVMDNGLLFITQTPENHRRIADLLGELRKGRTGMIRVTAEWVLLPAGEANRLYKNGPADPAALPEVSRAILDGLPHSSASIACLSGQTVHVTSGPARTLVTNATPVVAPGSVAFDVTQSFVQYGLALQVTPTAGGETVTLDLTSVASRLPDGAAPATRPTADGAAGIDRFAATVQSLQTTAQVPVGRPVLVGGMTLDAAAPGGDGRELYLVVEADTGK